MGHLAAWVLPFPLLFFVVLGTVQRSKLHRRTGRPVLQRHRSGGYLFQRGGYGGTNSGIHPITCAVAGGLLGFLLFNVYPASVFMGDTGFPGAGRFCGRYGVHDADATVYPHRGLYLCWWKLLSVVIQVSLFQGNRRQADFQDGADPSPFRAVRLVRDPGGGSIFDHRQRCCVSQRFLAM